MKINSLNKVYLGALLGYAVTFNLSLGAANVFLTIFSLGVCFNYKRVKEIVGDLDKKVIYGTIGLLILTFLIPFLFSPNCALAWSKIWGHIRYVLPFFAVPVFVKKKEQLKYLVYSIGLSCVAGSMVAIYQGLHGNYRAAAFHAHPMSLAGVLMIFIPWMVVEFNCQKFIKRQYSALILLVSTIALYFNGTRGAWIATFVSLVVLLLMMLPNKKKAMIAIVTISAVLFANYNAIPKFQQRMNSITYVEKDFSNKQRIFMWKSSINMIKDHPVLGIGIGQFYDQYGKKYKLPGKTGSVYGHPHNNFFAVATESGFVGLAGFCWFWGAILYVLLRRWCRENDIAALQVFICIISLLVQGLTETNWGNKVVMQYLLMLFGIYYVYRKFASPSNANDSEQ